MMDVLAKNKVTFVLCFILKIVKNVNAKFYGHPDRNLCLFDYWFIASGSYQSRILFWHQGVATVFNRRVGFRCLFSVYFEYLFIHHTKCAGLFFILEYFRTV